MLTVYKYTLQRKLHLPMYSKVLDVGLQGERVCVWVLVDTDQSLAEPHTLQVVGTGQELDKDLRVFFQHVTTLHTPMGLVWHVFQRKVTL